MLTVKEVTAFLNDHHITSSEQMVRRWLRQGRIKGVRPEKRKVGWRICTRDLIEFIESLQWEGTAYEEGIDDKTKIDRLLAEISELKSKIEDLKAENDQLRDKLGVPPF